MGNGKSLGAGRNLQGITQKRKEVSVRDGNGNQDLSAVATLEGRLEVFPEEILPVVHRETAAPHSDRLTEIVKLLLVELGVDVANQHFRETPERVARFYREFTGGFCVRPETILKTFSNSRSLQPSLWGTPVLTGPAFAEPLNNSPVLRSATAPAKSEGLTPPVLDAALEQPQHGRLRRLGVVEHRPLP